MRLVRSNSELGAAIVELAVGLFILLLLLTGFTTLNFSIGEQALMMDAVRSGARAGALSSTPVSTARAVTEQLLQLHRLDPNEFALNIRTKEILLPNLGRQQILQVGLAKITDSNPSRRKYERCFNSSYFVENGESEGDFASPEMVCFQ